MEEPGDSKRHAAESPVDLGVASRWATDALTALVLHGYLRPHPSQADPKGVTWRDAVQLRLVSKVLRDIVDSPVFWRAQCDLLAEDKLYEPPHLVELHARGNYLEAFRRGLREALRTNIKVVELERITFFSKALNTDGVREDVLSHHCDWWQYRQPRQHRFCGDGTLIALTRDPSSSSGTLTQIVGHWTYAFVPAAPNDFFICVVPIREPQHTLWRIQRHEKWCVLVVGPGALKSSCKLPLRGQEGCRTDELQVDEESLMTAEDRAMLNEACIAMDRAATTTQYVHNAPTTFRIPELHTFPHAEVLADDEEEEPHSGEGTP